MCVFPVSPHMAQISMERSRCLRVVNTTVLSCHGINEDASLSLRAFLQLAFLAGAYSLYVANLVHVVTPWVGLPVASVDAVNAQ